MIPEEVMIGRPKHLWKKGTSGNKNGRPKGSVSLTTRLKKYLAEHPEQERELMEAWIKYAKRGSFPHLKEIIERLDGKVKEIMEIKEDVEYRIVFDGDDADRND